MLDEQAYKFPRVRRRYASIIVAVVLGLLVFSLFVSRPVEPTISSTPSEPHPPGFYEGELELSTQKSPPQPPPSPPPPLPAPALPDPYSPLAVLNGPPTASFRDNLKPGEKYITSWISAGWTNDVMTYGNLIYLALITDRIPVMPMFTPSHIGGGVPPIAFGEVFDVPRLRQLLGKPVLEWREVKDERSDFMDELGCWNLWQAVQYREDHPRPSIVPQHLKIDVSYTKMPDWIKLIPNFEHDQHVTFWSLARFAFPETRKANLVTPRPSANHNVSLPPDEQMLCYDYLYYVCGQQPFEYDYDFSPAWRYAAKYMHFLPELEDLAEQYVRRGLGYGNDDTRPTPPYIVIHVRHLDFAGWCGDTPLTDCFAPLSVIARRVAEVKTELLEKQGIAAEHVVMTSDEKNETWWKEVTQDFGWVRMDHLGWAKSPDAENPAANPIKGAPEGLKRWHEWYPLLLDAAIQSSGVGFIGTDRSTMSIIAKRRAESWHNASTRTVMWGRPGADDH